MKTVALEDIADLIGQVVDTSEWFEIDQARVDAFADATGDHQWIHVDKEAAASGPFGTTIAHGFLTLSLLPTLAAGGTVGPPGVGMVINYGTNKVRFLSPVKTGSRVRAVSVLKDFAERAPGQYLATTEITIEIEGEGKPAMVAESLMLMFTTPEEEA